MDHIFLIKIFNEKLMSKNYRVVKKNVIEMQFIIV